MSYLYASITQSSLVMDFELKVRIKKIYSSFLTVWCGLVWFYSQSLVFLYESLDNYVNFYKKLAGVLIGISLNPLDHLG